MSVRPVPTGAAPAWFATRDDAPVALLERGVDPFGAPAAAPPAVQWTEDQLPWRDRDDFPSPRFPADDVPGSLFTPEAGLPVVPTGPAPAGLTGPLPVVRDGAPLRSLGGSKSVKRGVAAVVITGGAMSLMGAALPGGFDAGADVLSGTAALATFGSEITSPPPEVVLAPAFAPVDASPEVFDDAAVLVRAVEMQEAELARVQAEQLAAEEAARIEAERLAAEAEAARLAQERRAAIGADCELPSGIGAVQSHVREAAQFLGCSYEVDTIHGVAGRAGTSDHPSGRALDFMVDRVTGDQLAQCALDNMDALGVSYVIWEQQINTGSGWEQMEDRGGVTANHFDHVHVSFDGPGTGEPVAC